MISRWGARNDGKMFVLIAGTALSDDIQLINYFNFQLCY